MREVARQLPVEEITPRVAADIVWLQKTLGRRYRGYEADGAEFVVTLLRANGKYVWCYGPTLEAAMASARAAVQAAKEGK